MDETEATTLLLKQQVHDLELSNIRLIAELGRIAEALGVEPSMKKVLDRIAQLKETEAMYQGLCK